MDSATTAGEEREKVSVEMTDEARCPDCLDEVEWEKRRAVAVWTGTCGCDMRSWVPTSLDEDGDPLTGQADDTACACSGCGCSENATTTDDGGIPVCDECAEYYVTDDGEVACARTTGGLGVECPDCHAEIEWGCIQTGRSWCGESNYQTGTCACKGVRWTDTERGNGFPGDISAKKCGKKTTT